ncbi:MAG: sigma-54 dependent transcriptional regulator [Myxococcota bacterium]
MADVEWRGALPRGRLAEPLLALGVTLHQRHARPTLRVVRTSGAQVPAVVGDGVPWLWLSESRLPVTVQREAVLRGAYDVISLPAPDATHRLALRLRELVDAETPPPVPPGFIAESAAARKVLAQLARAARTSMPVLLTGETGTGKELCARLLHAWSPRTERRFVPINCAAIPNELMEAELFGYARGAFSGAVKGFDGWLMAAEGGTVFLDEIDDTPVSTQVKLLRVLEDHVVTRLGESTPHRVDFRLLAATNRDLRTLIASGSFGADFYERLAIVTVELPPLRARREDIPALARHFMARFQAETGPQPGRTPVTEITQEALAALTDHPWPGNIRELRNVVFEALVYKRGGGQLMLADLPRRILGAAPPTDDGGLINTAALERLLDAGRMDLREAVDELERKALQAALARASGNAARAARLLGTVGRGMAADPGSTLRAMMRRHGFLPARQAQAAPKRPTRKPRRSS